MGSSEIWDKYHECYIENGNLTRRNQVTFPFSMQHMSTLIVAPNFTVIQLVDTSLAAGALPSVTLTAMYAICCYVLNTFQH